MWVFLGRRKGKPLRETKRSPKERRRGLVEKFLRPALLWAIGAEHWRVRERHGAELNGRRERDWHAYISTLLSLVGSAPVGEGERQTFASTSSS